MRSMRTRMAGFTLIELMISIAIVLVLMVGVNFIFSSVGQATGMTQAVSRVTREMQGAQSVMNRDFITADMKNAPYVIIRSFATPGFKDRNDYTSAIDQASPRLDSAGTLSMFNTDNRIHRTDLLLFFSRDKFVRQTGGGTFSPGNVRVEPYLSDMSTQEAMIWYGHLRLPDDSSPGNFVNPGTQPLATNPNNFFASQWILGRVAILLQEPRQLPDPLAGRVITTKTLSSGLVGTDHWHIQENGGATDPPLRFNSPSYPVGYTLAQSRYDLAGTSMATMKAKMLDPTFSSGFLQWWNSTMAGSRFQARPFALGAAGQRLTPEDVALQAPIFLSNCTQFVVEYAGDFLTQDPLGNSIGTDPDGIVDYFVASSPNQRRQVRWYGLPRDTDTDGDIKGLEGDVVPLRDIRGSAANFERQVDTTLPPAPNYLDGSYTGPLVGVPMYTCAWGPNDRMPSMFRIVVAVDDPNGRFNEPLKFEYVFKVP